MQWLSAPALAALAGISRQKTHRALMLIYSGRATQWRGAALEVRTFKSKGGRSGVQYQVRVDTLPIELQQRFEAASKPPSTALAPRKVNTEFQAAREALLPYFAAIQAAPNSRERARQRREQSKLRIPDPKGGGRLVLLSERTLRRYEADYFREGDNSLARRKRSDAGRARAIISLKWDAVASVLPAEQKKEIAATLQRRVRSFWASGYKPAQIRLRINKQLEDMTREAGVEPPPGSCVAPWHFITREREKYQQIHEHDFDRKTSDDKLPRQPRDYTQLRVNERWFVDCHPCDILLQESDIYQRHAYFISWQDAATLRIHIDAVVLEKGRGITNAHVIASLRRAIAAMGVPEAIHVDNGSEFNCLSYLEDALKLANGTGGQVLFFSLPYNGPGKAPKEGFFGNFERNYLWPAPGQIGGDRMRSMIANGGRKPISWPATLGYEGFFKYIENQLLIYHHTPQSGRILNGRSPYQAYEEKIAAGDTRVELDEQAFILAASSLETRVIDRGAFQYDGRAWICEEAIEARQRKVLIRVPKYQEEWDRLPVYDAHEKFLGWATPQKAIGFLEKDGAKISARLKGLARSGIHRLRQDVDKIDHVAEVTEFASTLKPMPTAPSVGRIGVPEEQRAIADGVKENSKARRARENDEKNQAAAFDAEFVKRAGAQK